MELRTIAEQPALELPHYLLAFDLLVNNLDDGASFVHWEVHRVFNLELRGELLGILQFQPELAAFPFDYETVHSIEVQVLEFAVNQTGLCVL